MTWPTSLRVQPDNWRAKSSLQTYHHQGIHESEFFVCFEQQSSYQQDQQTTRVSKQAIQHFLDRRKESNRFYPVSSEKSRVSFRPSCSLKRSRQKRTNCLVYKSNGETFLNTHPCYHIAMGPTVLFPTLFSILWATTLSSTVVLGVIVTVLLFAFILIGNNDHYHLHYHTTTTIPPLPPLPHLFDWVTYFLFVFFSFVINNTVKY